MQLSDVQLFGIKSLAVMSEFAAVNFGRNFTICHKSSKLMHENVLPSFTSAPVRVLKLFRKSQGIGSALTGCDGFRMKPGKTFV